MIKNDRQYEYTKRRLREFESDLKTIRQKYSADKKKLSLLSQGYIKHIVQLKDEISEYDKIKKLPLPKILRVRNLDEISFQILRLRLARGLTQTQLAARIGCKQADISRLERDDYQGYTICQLKKIAACLGADIEIDLIPTRQ